MLLSVVFHWCSADGGKEIAEFINQAGCRRGLVLEHFKVWPATEMVYDDEEVMGSDGCLRRYPHG